MFELTGGRLAVKVLRAKAPAADMSFDLTHNGSCATTLRSARRRSLFAFLTLRQRELYFCGEWNCSSPRSLFAASCQAGFRSDGTPSVVLIWVTVTPVPVLRLLFFVRFREFVSTLGILRA